VRKQWQLFLQFQPLLNTCGVLVLTMGRGRRGAIEQSQKKPKMAHLCPRKNSQIYFHVVDCEKDLSFVLSGDVVEALKKMDPKDVSTLLIRN